MKTMQPDERAYLDALDDYAKKHGGKLNLNGVGKGWMVSVDMPEGKAKSGSEGGRSCRDAAEKLCETLDIKVSV